MCLLGARSSGGRYELPGDWIGQQVTLCHLSANAHVEPKFPVGNSMEASV
jgi:hypothetical protein